ncbi:hypothetical protein GQR58_023159 [Nymphon striatum]|nr:hypothetical protein GQR58_023159 [Nymphon striatum]
MALRPQYAFLPRKADRFAGAGALIPPGLKFVLNYLITLRLNTCLVDSHQTLKSPCQQTCRLLLQATGRRFNNTFRGQNLILIFGRTVSREDLPIHHAELLAESLGLNKEMFTTDLNSHETQQQLEKEIAFGRQIGAQGFPSMLLEKDGRFEYLPLDYNDPNGTLKYIEEMI